MKIDFLKPETAQIRHQIKNVIDSYSNDWDVLAELAQNAVDAIRVASPIKGHISVKIDACERSIEFQDNGCGIAPDQLPALLRPFSSGKAGNTELIGNKGVGVSFVIFSSTYFEIETHHEAGSSRARIDGANSWLVSELEELPTLDLDKLEATDGPGTKIKIKLPASDQTYEFFDMNFQQLEFCLRTKTALGDTKCVWSASKPTIDFVLEFKNKNAETLSEEIECNYFLPTERLSKSAYISLRDFQDWNSGDRTDAQKRQKLKDKLVYLDGTKEKGGRTIKYWACFVPKRKAWDIISVNSDLVSSEILELNPSERADAYGEAEFLFGGGMFTSTRGMPTGIRSEMRTKGSGGYLPNFFIILDDPQLSFDIGRKSIPGRQLGMLRDLASEVFRDFISGIRKHISGEPDVTDEPWERSKIFSEIHGMAALDSDVTKFLKRPYNQEASVAAIFFEMIGNGTINDIKPYVSGYRNKYDLYAKYKGSDVVIEFKHALGGLFRDFDDEVKLFDQLDIVVCWDVTEPDREVLASRGLDLQEIEEGISASATPFHYNLVLGPTKPIKILCIKRFID